MRFPVRILLLTVVVSAFTFSLIHIRTRAQSVRWEGSRSCATPPPGMIAWWPGEGNGDDIRGENNGELENVTFAPAKVGHGFTFTGQRGVVVPDSPALQQQAFTIDAWFTLNTFTCPGGPATCAAFIVAKSGSDGLTGYELDVRENGVLDFYINGGSEGGSVVSSIGSFSDGQFHHVAATYDGSNMNLYIDGELNNQTAFSGSVRYEVDSPLFIGGRQLTLPTTTYPGTIDEPEFYSRALSASEIQALFSADTGGKCKPRCTGPPSSLVGWWTADDNAFDIWNSNHGIEEAKFDLAYSNGKIGRAFDFDGLSDVRIPASRSLDVGPAGGLTIDAWIKPTFTDNEPIVEWNDGNTIGVHFWIISQIPVQPLGTGFSGSLFANIVDTNGNSHTIFSSPGIIKPDVFQHVAVTYDNKSQTAILYINGVNVAEELFDTSFFTPQTSFDVYIGRRPGFFGGPQARPEGFESFFNGLIDEVEIFGRALSESEIQGLNNAGFAGKCKPCLFPPFSMVGWWNADANTRDDSRNGNDGTLQGGYQLGKVGQAFSFNASANDGFVAPTSGSLSPTQAITLDAWVKPTSYPNNNSTVLSKEGDYLLAVGDGESAGVAHCNIGNFASPSGGLVPLDVWTHLACTYDEQNATARLYVNGEEVAAELAATPTPAPIPTSGADLSIGRRTGSTDGNFDGGIDEVEVFDRVLSQTEIQSIVAAGVSGKCKFDFLDQRGQAPKGNGPTVTLGDATITYEGVTFQTSTLYQTLDTYQVGPLPFGFNPPLHVVDISSGTVFNGTARVCFNLQASELSDPFLQLRILHLEGNALVNRTSFSEPSTRTLCADVTSLSPFVIAQNILAPSAAPASVSGRVTLPDGSPLAGAVIELTSAGMRSTITDGNGSYAFSRVATDAFYTVTPRRANYSFNPAELSFSLLGDKTDAVFTAIPDAVETRNPLDTDMFFVRQQYLDFLGREPDPGGLAYWTDQVRRCGTDETCARTRRVEISAAFFDSHEFQQTGSFIYRLYRGALARTMRFREYVGDRGLVIVGTELEATKLAYAAAFTRRPEFLAKYETNTTGDSFVDALLQNVGTAGADLLRERDRLISLYNSGNSLEASRALVLREIGNNVVFQQASYNEAFVLMEYFGYLQRDPDLAGYNFWLDVLNNREQGNYRGMVCAFITSAEYQLRFGSIVTRSNRDCGQAEFQGESDLDRQDAKTTSRTKKGKLS